MNFYWNSINDGPKGSAVNATYRFTVQTTDLAHWCSAFMVRDSVNTYWLILWCSKVVQVSKISIVENKIIKNKY